MNARLVGNAVVLGLVGDAVVLGLVDDDGNGTDVAPAVIGMLKELGSYVLVVEAEGALQPRPTGFTFVDYFEALSATLTLNWMRDDNERFVVWTFSEAVNSFPNLLPGSTEEP